MSDEQGQPDLRSPRRRSRIAQERVQPGRPSWAFISTLSAVCVIVFAILVYLTNRPPMLTAGESAVARDATLLSFLLQALPFEAVRVMAAVAGASSIAALAIAARRLLHAEGPALLAVGLLALDPSFLIAGHMAIPHIFVLATTLGALSLFIMPRHTLHWFGSALLLLGTLFEPSTILWAVPLAAITLVRGHIYVAPVHLITAVAQTFLIPAVGVLGIGIARIVNGAAPAECLAPSWGNGLLLRHVPDLGGIAVIPNPALWFVGLAALIILGALAASQVLLNFRLGRLPGRIQIRLPAPLPVFHARMLWLLVLAAFAPHPMVWLALGAIAIAAAIRELGQDAPGFGLALGATALGFGVMWLWRAQAMVNGTATPQEMLDMARAVPWSTLVSCS